MTNVLPPIPDLPVHTPVPPSPRDALTPLVPRTAHCDRGRVRTAVAQHLPFTASACARLALRRQVRHLERAGVTCFRGPERRANAAVVVLDDIGPEVPLALGLLTTSGGATRLTATAPSCFSPHQADRVASLIERWNRSTPRTRLIARPSAADGTFLVEASSVAVRLTPRRRDRPVPAIEVVDAVVDGWRWLLAREAPTHALESVWDRHIVPDVVRGIAALDDRGV